jgi:glycerophosphoryl diester phosphodiesterase
VSVRERWKRARLPWHRTAFVVVAHRGAHTQAPENSLPALEAAIAAGVDFVECDLRTTRDGQIVILHDATLERTTAGKGKLAEKTLAEVKALTIRNSTERVPTFEELLKESRGRVGFYLDCKAVDPAQAFALVKRYKLTEHVLAYTSPEGALAWKRAAPQVCVMTSPPDAAKTHPQGVIYLVTGAGGAGLYNPEQQDKPETLQPFTDKYIANIHSFTVVEINGKQMLIKQLDEDGKELDRFTVTK